MHLNTEAKALIGILVFTVGLIAVAAFLFSQPEKIISREELITPLSMRKGNNEAKNFLVEFSDFQCPACKAAKPFVDEVVEKNKDKLLFVYRHFPLSQHLYGEKAAIASEAAANQGKFWEMYNFLFENQEQLSDEKVQDLAKQLNLNMNNFNKDLKDPALQDKVKSDQQTGIRLGVNSTPTFFLNGKKLSLTSYANLPKVVEEAIKL